MKTIELKLSITEDLTLKQIIVSYNDTGLENDPELLRMIGSTIVRAVDTNREECEIQYMLNKLNINHNIGK